VDRALDGAYRRLRFSSEDLHPALAPFFEEISSLLLSTRELLLDEEHELKLCPHLLLCMGHKVGEEEREETIHLWMKAALLLHINLDAMEEQFEERLESFLQRGSGFRLKYVEAMEWEVVCYESIPFHVGHGKSFKLPPKLAAKKAVVNVDNNGGNDCFR